MPPAGHDALTISRNARSVYRAGIPSAGHRWPGGVPAGNFTATIPSARSWLKRAPQPLSSTIARLSHPSGGPANRGSMGVHENRRERPTLQIRPSSGWSRRMLRPVQRAPDRPCSRGHRERLGRSIPRRSGALSRHPPAPPQNAPPAEREARWPALGLHRAGLRSSPDAPAGPAAVPSGRTSGRYPCRGGKRTLSGARLII